MGTRTVYLENRQEELKSGLEILLSVHHFTLTEEKQNADICILAEPCEEETGKTAAFLFMKRRIFSGEYLWFFKILKRSPGTEKKRYILIPME